MNIVALMHTTKIPVIPRREQVIEMNGEEYILKEGEVIELPKWLVPMLDVECVPLKSSEIKAMLMKERGPRLSEIPDDFYDRMEFSQDRETQKAFLQLLDVRLEKIARMSCHPVELELPDDEQILYDKIQELVAAWKRDMVRRVLHQD
ncbi:MAG: hypothetical protein HXS52_02655 [Theionarchaea archaeon]|nr:hypothetical protein [Theionarchaea archaeon]MBU7036805.1 hypothetical protein [Theionarchaea archaeon]